MFFVLMKECIRLGFKKYGNIEILGKMDCKDWQEKYFWGVSVRK